MDNPAFQTWVTDIYARRFPPPPRDRRPPDPKDVSEFGFRLHGSETYSNEVGFTCDGLVGYLVTQSNVIAVVEGGSEAIEDVKQWLRDEVSPYFRAHQGTFVFAGPIWYLQKY